MEYGFIEMYLILVDGINKSVYPITNSERIHHLKSIV